MDYLPLPIPDIRERLDDYSVKLTWKNLTFEQVCWLIKQAYFFREVVFADLYYYGQVFSIEVKIGPDDSITVLFPNSGIGAITDEMVKLVIKKLTTLPKEIALNTPSE